MKFKILGSGGMYPTPLPNCHCDICESARNGNKNDVRSMPSLYLEDIKLLIDTPEDIFNTLEKNKIDDIDYISLSHKDPDHIRGIRLVEGMYFDWKKEVPKKTIKFFSLPIVVDEINEMNGNTLKFYSKVLKVIDIETFDQKEINGIKISMLNNLTNGNRNVINYVFEKNGKKVIYACCNAKPFKDFQIYNNADVLIISMVDLTRITNPNRESYKFDNELFSIKEIEDLKRKYNIKKVICTHIDCNWGNKYDVLKNFEKQLDEIEFAYDGMEFKV